MRSKMDAHKKHRGRGVGKESENTPAVLLYSALGFVPCEIEERKDSNNKRMALVHMKLARSGA